MVTDKEAARRDELRIHLRNIIDAVHAFDSLGGAFASSSGPIDEDDLSRGIAELDLHAAIAGYIHVSGKHAGIGWRVDVQPRSDQVCAALVALDAAKGGG